MKLDLADGDKQGRAGPKRHGASAIVGNSPAMKRLREVVRRVGSSRARSVVIFGETGSGKGLVARAIHEESDRRDRPFVSLTCSAIPEQLLETELFGHEAGAFTDGRARKIGLLEAANGGTLFLDEIGDMPPMLQAKLLGVLEERVFRRLGGVTEVSVDLRILSATHRDLEAMVAAGSFREDLMHRLCVIPMHVPALRVHPKDIPELAEHFAGQLVEDETQGVRITEAASAFLQELPWRGNARELRNAIERAIALCPDSTLDVHAFAWKSEDRRELYALPPEGVDVERLIDDLVHTALERSSGNQTAAAQLLRMTRNQLRYRMSKMGLLPVSPAASNGRRSTSMPSMPRLLRDTAGAP